MTWQPSRGGLLAMADDEIILRDLNDDDLVDVLSTCANPEALLAEVETAASAILKREDISDWFPPLSDDASQGAQIARSAMFAAQGARLAVSRSDAPSALVEGMKAGRLIIAMAITALEKPLKTGRGARGGASKGGKSKAASDRARNADRNAGLVTEMNRLVGVEETTPNSAANTLSKRSKLSPRQILNVWKRSRSAPTH